MIPALPRRAALAIVISLLALSAGCYHAPTSSADPESAATAFFALVAKGDSQDAFNSAAFGFQAAQTEDAFNSNVIQLGLVGSRPPLWTSNQVQGSQATLGGAIVTQSGAPINVVITMTQDHGDWKLFGIKTLPDNSGASPENRFTLVGKGSGFNDVYHQPMPDPQDLALLVHQTIARLNSAVQTKNFHNFYLTLSQQWRDGQRTTGDTTEGVTENILKSHFQGFIDKKIDLSAAASLPPIYSKPPIINDAGLLDLEGHFAAPAYNINFQFQYVYELPRWKLFGIDVNVTSR